MTPTADTIVALATGSGGAIAIIRLSGSHSIAIADQLFKAQSGQRLSEQKGFTLHYGLIKNDSETVDDVLLSLFRAPHSYTGEEMVEFSCHASSYIQQEIIRLCIAHGARSAQPGEFTLRAFLSGKMDLSQAEAVADVIASNSRASHQLATRQIRGGYSEEFAHLRAQLIHVASLLELELDFGEEEVEFADRAQLHDLIVAIQQRINHLVASFQLGNILKNGIPVILVGSPNVGKSTLMNGLVHEEKALVSEIPGTTRDIIEECMNIGGTVFRFIDTAGIRPTDDPLESMGIDRTLQHLSKAVVVLVLVDAADDLSGIRTQVDTIDLQEGQHAAILLNKIDRIGENELSEKITALEQWFSVPVFGISAKKQTHLNQVIQFLETYAASKQSHAEDIVVFNARHHAALTAALTAVERAREALETELPGDLLAQDIREVLHHLETITGEITTEDILQSIFSKFCIGK